jgi:hypothetical protein
MTVLKRFALLSVLLGSVLLGAAAWPFSVVAAAEPGPKWTTVYEVWGKDARDVATATPENPDPGAWILLGSSLSRAGAQQTIATITRHGGYVRLHIKETQVKPDPRRVGVKEKTNGNVLKPLDDGMVQPKRPIGEIKPKTPAPRVLPRPKGIDVVQPPAATPLPTKALQKAGK